MKRYLLFGGEIFYPNGGMQDFILDSNNISYIYNWLKKNKENYNKHKDDEKYNENDNSKSINWWHIYDTYKLKITFTSDDLSETRLFADEENWNTEYA